MLGLMQNWPLTNDKLLEHAKRNHFGREVVTRSVEGPIVRTTYGAVHDRARKLSSALKARGIKLGDRIGTIAWNTDRHLESWYAITGLGAIYHTINPRLFPDQIAYIANHAEDRIILTDLTFVPLLEAIGDRMPSVEAYIVMTDRAHMPQTHLPNVLCYEDLVDEGSLDIAWGGFDENTAAGLCYTSGTTGNPKGVLYSHRSNTLMGLIAAAGGTLPLTDQDSCLMVVPMFHANAWGLAFLGPLSGVKLVMPGARYDGGSIYELLDTEQCSFAAAVPTVWTSLLQHLDQNKLKLPHLKRVVIGGAAAPKAMIERFDKDFGVEVIHAWGMTEMSPIGTSSQPSRAFQDASYEERLAVRMKQGRTPFGVEMKITGADGQDLPRDGQAFGNLLVKGPCVSSAYFRGEASALDADGWFDTGDVATIDPNGYMQITDRAKDVIKSGGEWISSIDLENAAMGAPGVLEACVIGMPHPKWDERPLLIIVAKPGADVTKAAVLAYLEGKIAKWWTPDDVMLVDELPHTATGKLDKKALRERYKAYVFPTAASAAE